MNFVRASLFSTSLTLLTFAALANAQISENPKKFVIDAIKISRDIKLNGTLSDPLWKTASPVELNFEIQPGDNTPARQKTLVYVLYNSDYIYCGFNCSDSSAKLIRAHITDRDNAFDDDFVGILLDTYGTMQDGYEFFENPYAIQMDAMRTGNNEDFSFDCIWYSAAHVNDTGWTAEVAIPFKSLRFPSISAQHWILNLVRNMPRDSRYQMTWTTIDRNNPCIFCQSGTIDGINGIETSNNIELLPYVMGLQSSSLNNSDDPFSGFANGPITGRIGAGVKYAPSSSFVLAGVVNPDFSQIESDATQISINNTFAIFYPEKRPFFLEGANLYSTAASIFYSRMINDPLASVKLSEKAGSFSLAYLGAEDRESPFIIPGEEGSDFVSSNMKSWSNVVRGKYNLGKESFIGGLVTTRNFANAHNYVGTVDWNILFAENFYFTGQAGVTDTKEINDPSLFSSGRHFGSTSHTATFDGESYSGSGFQTDISRNARDYSFDLNLVSVTPTFQAQDGFITQNDFRQINVWQGYMMYFDNSFIEKIQPQIISGASFNNDDGTRKSEWGAIDVWTQLKAQTQLWVKYYPVQEEFFHSVRFRKLYRTEAGLYSAPSKALQINLWAQVGRLLYHEDTPELGRGYNTSAEVTVKPTDRFSFDFTYAHSRLWSFYTNELFFDGYISRVVTVYQFTPELFVRLISQYDGFAKQLQIDPLFSFKLNPFTVFYAGSAHNLTDFGDQFGIRQTARQFFIKLQYLWRE
ncbi:MAG: carbohydrate binding family 9 domain-containing protein [Bacteroidota bacterium]|nr:carbohydrate binding family 9 domain-containing protein [Bacteroidota bacterium]